MRFESVVITEGSDTTEVDDIAEDEFESVVITEGSDTHVRPYT